jgi:hypothetical protein
MIPGVSLGLGERGQGGGCGGWSSLRPQRACLRARKFWRARWLSVAQPKFTKWAANTSVGEHRATGKSIAKNAVVALRVGQRGSRPGPPNL